MKALTEREQTAHRNRVAAVESALAKLKRHGGNDEDVRVAIARLENWLVENKGRWVK